MSDLISRQAAIDALCNDYCGGRQDCKYYPKCENLKAVQNLPSAQPEILACGEGELNVPDINVGYMISRRAAIIQLSHNKIGDDDCDVIIQRDIETIKQMPSAEPDIIYCKDCLKHNKRIGDYVEKSDGTYYWIWKGQACPLAEFRGVAQGHEFDYQFCAYAERRTE